MKTTIDGEYIIREYDSGVIIRELNSPAPLAAIEREWTPNEFLDKFTQTETFKIYTAAKTDVLVEALIDRIKVSPYILTSDPRTITAINYLQSQNLLDNAGRAAEILR